MAEGKFTDQELDAVFDTAQRHLPQLSQDWMDRVTADAAQVLDARRAPPAPSLWDQILNALGGRPGVGGLVAASAFGLWLGVAPPAVIGDPVGAALGGAQTVELLADTSLDYAAIWDEG